MRTTHTIFLALGSNLGDRQANLQAAIQALPPAIQVLRLSSIYETKPWGYQEQPDFLNQVLQGETQLAPVELMRALKELEQLLGRQATFHYGPRLIDLDILFYDDLILAEAGLIIPHPRLAERAFVLVPLAELAPDKIHPALKQTISHLLAGVDTQGVHLYTPS